MICCLFIALAAGITGLYLRLVKSNEDSLDPNNLPSGDGESCVCAINQTSNRRKKALVYGSMFVLCALGLAFALTVAKCLLGHHS